MHRIEHAVVVGSGISGLCAAAALSPYARTVTLIESETLPDGPTLRRTVPQGYHNHSLLAGGADALFRLFPGLESTMIDAGANRLRMNQDVLEERLGLEQPSIDYGYHVYTQTRPLLEFLVQREVRSLPNVWIREQCIVETLCLDRGAARVTGVRLLDKHSNEKGVLSADLVIVATGNDKLLRDLFEQHGLPPVEQTSIMVDMGYTSAYYRLPNGIAGGWKAVLTGPGSATSSRGALLFPMEQDEFVLALTARGEEKPGTTESSVQAFLESLCSPTILRIVNSAERVREFKGYGFKTSRLQRYHEYQGFPAGVLPLGDSISRANPIYGQGITVLALEAVRLSELLESGADPQDPGFHQAYFKSIWPIVSAAWDLAATKDFDYPTTIGEKPANHATVQHVSRAMERLLARDPEFAKLSARVLNFLQPPESLNNAEVLRKLFALS